jgi:hypothetical protein
VGIPFSPYLSLNLKQASRFAYLCRKNPIYFMYLIGTGSFGHGANPYYGKG